MAAEPGPATPRERVARMLHGQPPDRPIWGELVIDDALIAAYLGTSQIEQAHRLEFVERLGMDAVCAPLDWDGRGMGRLSAWAESGEYFVFALLSGAFAQGVADLGFEAFMLKVARQDSGLPAFFRGCATRLADLTRRALDSGADGVILGDDIAYQQGLLAPPAFFREHYLPSLRAFTDAVSQAGAPAFFHSDGDLRELLPDLVACGFDGLHCLEKAAGMDMAAGREAVGSGFCLWGNLDPALLAPGGDQARLAKEVDDILRAGRPGPFIFGTSSGLYAGMSPQALDWIRRALTEHSSRPLPGSVE